MEFCSDCNFGLFVAHMSGSGIVVYLHSLGSRPSHTHFLGMTDYLESTQRRHWTFSRKELSGCLLCNDEV